MSIIHDALKKVQQGLNAKSEELPVTPPVKKDSPAYLYGDAPAAPTFIEPKKLAEQQAQKPKQDKLKATLALICAAGIIVVSCYFIYQQFQSQIPKVQVFTRQTINKLLHKKDEHLDFRNTTPQELKPLAQVTFTPSSTPNAGPQAPVTLSIHGIMANASGNLALINDQVYQEGDTVQGAKILKINLDSIKISSNGVEQTILVKG